MILTEVVVYSCWWWWCRVRVGCVTGVVTCVDSGVRKSGLGIGCLGARLVRLRLVRESECSEQHLPFPIYNILSVTHIIWGKQGTAVE